MAGQRLMQAASDIFLGWQRIKGLDGMTRDYYVRQFHDWKGGADVDGCSSRAPRCTRASAERRSPGRTPAGATGSPSRPTSARATCSTAAIADFSAAYADQNERDYEAFVGAVNSGRLVAQMDL